MPSTEQPPTAPPPDSSADLQRPSVGSRILQRLPIVLMVSLVAMHVLVAAGDFIKRDYFPAHLIHAAYTVVIDQTHYLNGYLPQVVHRDEIGEISKVIIDGRRGPEPQWSDPRI